MRKLVLITSVLLVSIFACDRKGIFEKNLLIPNEEWAVDSVATFTAAITDTTSAHNIYINVRNTAEYPNSNLYLFITTHSPSGVSLRDTLECRLADSKGNWLGKGFGRIRDNQIPYKMNIRFPLVGDYRFDIQHGMRTNILKEIVSVGVRIERKD